MTNCETQRRLGACRLALAWASIAMAGCGAPSQASPFGNDDSAGAGGTASPGGAGGMGGTVLGGSGGLSFMDPIDVVSSGGSDADPNQPCEGVSQEVKIESLPVDIIWGVDTSGSLLDETAAVQESINAFSQQIVAANIDVHVIMLAGYPFLGVGVCVGPPLGTGDCSMPGGDSQPPMFFHHPSAVVDSWNGALAFVDRFPDYQQYLRPNSLKYLVIVTDDDSAVFPGIPLPVTCGRYCDNPTAFIDDLTALPMMQAPGGGPAWKLSGVYSQSQCPNATRIGTFWKTVIDQTGGVHGDLCACTNPTTCAQTFEAVLDLLATTITTAAKPLDCEYAIPPPPEGRTFDKERVNVELVSNGVPENIGFSNDAAGCHPEVGGWYYDDDENPTRILTCPVSCDKIQATTDGRVSVAFGCERQPVPMIF